MKTINVDKDKYTKEDLLNYYESGLTIKQVAKIYNLDDETIRKRNKLYGINIRDYNSRGKTKSITKEELIEYYTSGMSISDVSKIYNVDSDVISEINKNFGINIKDYYEFRANYDVHIFDIIDTEEKAYWLGFLFADGNVRGKSNEISLEISSTDYNHLVKFKNFMKDTRLDCIKSQKRIAPISKKELSFVSYQVCSPILKNSLIKLGCIPNKSLILKFPDINNFKNSELIYDFIRGYIDGDGCLGSSKSNRLVISVRGTKDFLNSICEIFPNEFKKVYSELDKRTEKMQYRISCCHSKADIVAQKLYGNATIYLDRKYEKFTALCKLYSEKSGKNGEV